jgi:hypothetical protein
LYLFRVKLGSKLSDLAAVNGDSTIHDKFIGTSPARDSSIGNNLV